MFVEFNEDEKLKLIEIGYIEEPNHKFIYTDTELGPTFQIKKLPDNSIEVEINFSDGEPEVVPFPSFDSFIHITKVHIGG